MCVCKGDEEEWKQQRQWHTELTAVLNRVSVLLARQQCEQDRSTNLGDEQPVSFSAKSLLLIHFTIKRFSNFTKSSKLCSVHRS